MFNREELLAVKGTPLQPNRDSDEAKIRTKLVPGVASNVVVGDPVTQQDVKAEMEVHRPFYFMRSEVRKVADKIGYTEGCPGCRAVKHDFSSRPPHSSECRLRMEPEMQKSARGKARMEEWQNKMASEVERRIREENCASK